VHVGNGLREAQRDGLRVKKSSFAMVILLPATYVGFGVGMDNPTANLVLVYSFCLY